MARPSNPPSSILQAALVAAGLGTFPDVRQAWPISDDLEAAQPDNFVTINDTTGMIDGTDMDTGERLEHYGVQIRVRGQDQFTAWSKANAIANALDQILVRVTVVVGSNLYCLHRCTRRGSIIRVGHDTPTSRRFIYTINPTLQLEPI